MILVTLPNVRNFTSIGQGVFVLRVLENHMFRWESEVGLGRNTVLCAAAPFARDVNLLKSVQNTVIAQSIKMWIVITADFPQVFVRFGKGAKLPNHLYGFLT